MSPGSWRVRLWFPMRNVFRLVDLVSQRHAVRLLLAECAQEQKLLWLAQYGEISEIPSLDSEGAIAYRFESRVGLVASFFFGDDDIVFLGEHSTFR